MSGIVPAWPALSQEAVQRSLPARRRRSAVMLTLFALAAVLALVPLLAIVGALIADGARNLTPAFFTQMPRPLGESDGGMANAIAGTAIILGMAMVMGIPTGLAAGIYLAERPDTRLARSARYAADVLHGMPSIVVGIATWAAVVRPMGRFSGFAGAVALAVLMTPLVARTTEEMVRVVPAALRQAALALGFAEWRASIAVVLPAARPGIVTGVLLAVARVAGETAPLLFTAFGNQFWSLAPMQPMAALPLQLYADATSPYDGARRQAWAAALLLVVVVALLTISARWLVGRRGLRGR